MMAASLGARLAAVEAVLAAVLVADARGAHAVSVRSCLGGLMGATGMVSTVRRRRAQPALHVAITERAVQAWHAGLLLWKRRSLPWMLVTMNIRSGTTWWLVGLSLRSQRAILCSFLWPPPRACRRGAAQLAAWGLSSPCAPSWCHRRAQYTRRWQWCGRGCRGAAHACVAMAAVRVLVQAAAVEGAAGDLAPTLEQLGQVAPRCACGEACPSYDAAAQVEALKLFAAAPDAGWFAPCFLNCRRTGCGTL